MAIGNSIVAQANTPQTTNTNNGLGEPKTYHVDGTIITEYADGTQAYASAIPENNIDGGAIASFSANNAENLISLLSAPEFRPVNLQTGKVSEPAIKAKFYLTKNAFDAADLSTSIMESDEAWAIVKESLIKEGLDSPYARLVGGVNVLEHGELQTLAHIVSSVDGRELAIANAANASQISMAYHNALDAHLSGDLSNLTETEALIYNRFSQEELVDAVTFNRDDIASSVQTHIALTSTGLATSRVAYALTRNQDALTGAIGGLGLFSLGGASSIAGLGARLFTSAGIIAGAPDAARSLTSLPNAIFAVQDIQEHLGRAREAIVGGASTLDNPILQKAFSEITLLNAKALDASAGAARRLLGNLPLNRYTRPITSGISHGKLAELATMMSVMEFAQLGIFEEFTTIFAGNNGVPMMQNASDHGIDLMARYKDGDWISFEIKASINGTHLPLNKTRPNGRVGQNAGAHAYTLDRLDYNANERSHWIDPFKNLLGLDSRSGVAETILDDMDDKIFSGHVVSFTNWGKNSIGLRIRNW